MERCSSFTQHSITSTPTFLPTCKTGIGCLVRYCKSSEKPWDICQTDFTSDSLLQISTNPQIAQALFDPSKKYAAEHPWQLPFDKDDLLELIEELSVRDDVPYTALPDVPETLRYLKHRGYKLGIATTDTLTATVAGLKKTGIFDYFDYLGTGEESKPKPDTFLADIFCSQCDLKANEILIVGDSQNDMRFAENAGAFFIGI